MHDFLDKMLEHTGPHDELLRVDETTSMAYSKEDVDEMALNISVRTHQDEPNGSVEVHGRSYQGFKEGQYYLPNDQSERNRLDFQHHLFLQTFKNKLYLSPTGELRHALDIGTGTGNWAIEFARGNPGVSVLGTDLSPVPPDVVPSNCTFITADAEDPWILPQQYDLIHGRALATCFNDAQKVVSSAAAALAPGGWLEIQDIVLPMRCVDASWDGSSLQTFLDRFVAAAAKTGRDVTYSGRYNELFRAAGLVDVKQVHPVWPTNPWCQGDELKKLGMWFGKDLSDGIEGIGLALLTRVEGKSEEEIRAFLGEVKKDILDGKIHAYMPLVVCMGRKPLEGA